MKEELTSVPSQCLSLFFLFSSHKLHCNFCIRSHPQHTIQCNYNTRINSGNVYSDKSSIKSFVRKNKIKEQLEQATGPSLGLCFLLYDHTTCRFYVFIFFCLLFYRTYHCAHIMKQHIHIKISDIAKERSKNQQTTTIPRPLRPLPLQ